MHIGLVISVLLHVSIIILAIRGLPHIFEPEPFENPPMVVDLVMIDDDIKTPDPVVETEREILAKAKVAAEKKAKAAKDPPKLPDPNKEEPKPDDTPVPQPRKVAALPTPPERKEAPKPKLKNETNADPDLKKPDIAKKPELPKFAALPKPGPAPRPGPRATLAPTPTVRPDTAKSRKKDEALKEPEPIKPAVKPKRKALTKPSFVPTPKVKPKKTKVASIAPKNSTKPKKKPTKKPDLFGDISKLLSKQAKTGAVKSARTSKTATARAASSIKAKPGTQMTMSEIDAVRRQIEKCWNFEAGARNAKNMIVDVKIELRKDGSLARAPKIIDTARMAKDPFYRAAAERARRAVIECSPIIGLPEKKFTRWQSMTLQFNPRDMVGG